MTKVRLLALLAVVALVLFPALAYAQGGLQPPCAFHGKVQVNGANVADGTIITATIEGTTFTTTTPSGYGASTYAITIAQPEGKSFDGKTVSFKIGNDTAAQTGIWQVGGNVALDLSKGAPPVTPPAGGGITSVTVNTLAAGQSATASYNSTTGVLTLGIPAGAKGDTGATGATGATGPAGKNASSVLGIVAIIIAVIALGLAGMVMMRKKA